MELRVHERVLGLRRPLRTAGGVLRERVLFEVELEGDDGVVGRGEAAPLEPYDGVPAAVVREALHAYARALATAGNLKGPEVLETCRAAADLPQALAAVDLALWDRAGRREGRPVAALLADDPLTGVPVNALVGAGDRAGAAREAAAAAQAGYRCVKVKVGTGDDAGRVAAVRAAVGPSVALRLDANGAWTVGDAVRWIETLAASGLELVEEPVHGLDAVRAVRAAVPVRVAIDETAAQPGALASGAADAVCLKISRAGGIASLLAQAALVRATGSDVYLASTLDGPLGIAAAVHAAAALRIDLPCGLATLHHIGLDAGALEPHDGAIAVPGGPGLLG